MHFGLLRPPAPTFHVDVAQEVRRLLEIDSPYLSELVRDLDHVDGVLLLNRGNAQRLVGRLQALVVREGWVPAAIYHHLSLSDLVDYVAHGGAPWDLMVHDRTHAEQGIVPSTIGAPRGTKVVVCSSTIPASEFTV